MKLTIKSVAFWAMIIFIFALGIYLVVYLQSNSYRCMNDPYVYSIKLLEKANNANVSCLCTAYKYNPATVLLTDEGFKPVAQMTVKSEPFKIVNLSG